MEEDGLQRCMRELSGVMKMFHSVQLHGCIHLLKLIELYI